MEKSVNQKALKVLSILMIVFSACALVLGIVLIVGHEALAIEGILPVGLTSEELSIAVVMLGVVLIVSALVNGVIGLLGLRGANNPQKIKVYFILAVIGTIFALFGTLQGITSGTAGTTSVVNFTGVVLPLVGAVLAYKIKKENNL